MSAKNLFLFKKKKNIHRFGMVQAEIWESIPDLNNCFYERIPRSYYLADISDMTGMRQIARPKFRLADKSSISLHATRSISKPMCQPKYSGDDFYHFYVTRSCKTMTDYAEEQRNELEAIESIYPESFTGLNLIDLEVTADQLWPLQLKENVRVLNTVVIKYNLRVIIQSFIYLYSPVLNLNGISPLIMINCLSSSFT